MISTRILNSLIVGHLLLVHGPPPGFQLDYDSQGIYRDYGYGNSPRRLA